VNYLLTLVLKTRNFPYTKPLGNIKKMKNIIILIALIFISCKNENKAEKEKSIEIIVSDTIIEQEKKTDLTENLNPKDIALDSIWLNKIFKDTPLTSDSGEFYSGYKSKVYRITSDTLQNKKLNTYRKKVGIEDGTLSETYAVLLSKNEDVLYDLKWIGNNGQIAECEMKTEFNSNANGLTSKYSFLCFDGYDEKLNKEFMADKITTFEITIEQNSLIVKRDTLTKRTELK
jgi:hypothetical protein